MLLPDQEEFFRFFEMRPPAGMSAEGAQRFMEAYLKDPQRAERWKKHRGVNGVNGASRAALPASPASAPTVTAPPPAPTRPVSPATPTVHHAGPEIAVARRFEFTGSGGEYFGIWIVNLLLSIVTLGLYSPWAKVRRMQYFYRHTQVDGASFDYHGNALAILKGRLVALVLFVLYSSAGKASPLLGFISLLVLGGVLPWLLRASLRFRLRNSSYRGLRFRFGGEVKEAYWTFLVRPVVAFFTLYLAAPWAHQRLKRYQHGNSFLGKTPFAFGASVGQYYKEWLLIGGAGLLVMIVPFTLMFGAIRTMAAAQQAGTHPDPSTLTGPMTLAVVLMFAGMLLLGPLFQARLQNLTWNHTTLGPHRFESAISVWKLFGIQVTNVLLVMITLGLFMPWAMVRAARYRVETMSLVAAGSLETFVAQQEQETAAVGEETAEMFDIDIAL